MPAAKVDKLSSIPRTHTVKGVNQLIYKLSSDLYMHTPTHASTYVHTIN